jgi:hypothetical protein
LRRTREQTNKKSFQGIVLPSGITAAPLRVAPDLFNHLISGDLQGERHGDAEHVLGLEIDAKLKIGGLYDRQVRRLPPFTAGLEDY